jgi:prepilin-type N-terminal cleavage/methylation domain-containing protein/prepilin-type processing-associated H-X9-DG protein
MFHSSRKAFTLIELLVVIAIIAILAAILFPVFAQAKRAAKKTVCLSGEKQIALGAIMYSNDYDDLLPPPDSSLNPSPGVYATSFWWYEVTDNYNTTPITNSYDNTAGLLQPYLKNSQIDGCPEASGQIPIGGPGGPPMGISENIWSNTGPTSSFDSPASTIMLADQGILYGYAGDVHDYARPEFFVYADDFLPSMEGRHNGGSLNAAWFDGHAKSARIGIGDLATNNGVWGLPPYYIQALQQRSVGWVFPPGVSSAASDPRFNCYYLPVDSYSAFGGYLQMSRPSNCPQ